MVGGHLQPGPGAGGLMQGPGAGRKGAPPGAAAPWGSRRIGPGEGLRRREPGLGNQTWGGAPGLGDRTCWLLLWLQRRVGQRAARRATSTSLTSAGKGELWRQVSWCWVTAAGGERGGRGWRAGFSRRVFAARKAGSNLSPPGQGQGGLEGRGREGVDHGGGAVGGRGGQAYAAPRAGSPLSPPGQAAGQP